MSDTSLHLTVDVAAPVEQVWAVLTDFDAYGDWHPYIASAHGELVLGSLIQVNAATASVTMPDIEIVEVEIPRLLVFEGGDADQILVRHHWELIPLPNRATRVHDHEIFRGPQASAMFAQYSEAMRRQLEPILDAFKTAVESRSAGTKQARLDPGSPPSE